MSAANARESLAGRLRDEGLQASPWSNGAGDRYAEHSHAYDKVLVAATGSITFHLPGEGRDVALSEGERLDLPAGTSHAATVGPAGVTCLEAHVPAGTLSRSARHRADW